MLKKIKRKLNSTSDAVRRVVRTNRQLQADVAKTNELLAYLVGGQEQLMGDIAGQRQLVDLLEVQRKSLKILEAEVKKNNEFRTTMRFSVAGDLMNEVEEFCASRQFDLLTTVKELVASDTSFARFGDGEFKSMLNSTYRLGFQSNSPELRRALAEVLTEPLDGLLVGFPTVYRNAGGFTVWPDVWPRLKPLVHSVPKFGNSHVSRPLFFQQYGDEGVEAWRQVWAGKDVCVITGSDSRFEPVPALFSSAKSFQRVDSVSREAFADLDRLLNHTELPDVDMFLISLGPAGTILTRELAKRGRRALDIGHISDSYQNVFEGAAWPESKPAVRK